MDLNSPISELKGLGPKSAEKFLKLEIITIKDLLLYFPFRYEDFKQKKVFDLIDGEKAVIVGQVVTPANVQYYGFKRNRLSFKLKQDEVVINISFFNQPYLADKIELGQDIAVFGKWDQKKTAITGMKILIQTEDDMQPVYHVAQGISQSSLVKAIKSAMNTQLLEELDENLPDLLLKNIDFLIEKQLLEQCIFQKILMNINKL